MARNSISDELIIEISARLSNKVGLDNLLDFQIKLD